MYLRAVYWIYRGMRRCTCRIVPVLLGAAPSIGSAAWEAVPEVNLGISTSDNVLRTPEGEQSGSRTVLDGRVTLSYFDERANLFLVPGLAVDAYADSDQEALENEDVFLRAGGEYRWQTVTSGFRIDYADRSVLRAEFEDAVPGDPDIEDPNQGDTGRVGFAEQQREFFFIGANVDFNVSMRDVLRFEIGGSEAAYSVASGPDRSGYDYNEATIEFARRVNDRNAFFVAATAAHFTAPSNDNETDAVGLLAGFTRDLSQAWRLNLTAGANALEYDFIDGATQTRIIDDATAPTFGMGLRKRNERSTWNLDLNYTLNPNSNGYLTETARARIFLRQRFTPRLTGQFGLLVTTRSPADNLDETNERDYTRLQMTFEWTLTRTTLLTFGVDSIRQEYPNEGSRSTDSNSAFVGVTYRGLSRQNQ